MITKCLQSQFFREKIVNSILFFTLEVVQIYCIETVTKNKIEEKLNLKLQTFFIYLSILLILFFFQNHAKNLIEKSR